MAKEYLSKQQYQQWRYPTTEDFASLQANLRLVLWDFDIPITHLFSGLSAYTVTQYLRDYLWEKGLAKEEDLIDTDPHTIYRRGKRFADNDIESYFELERLLTEKECEAAKLADPTPNAIELIRALDANGIQQAIVTNNSPKAATIYLQKQKLEHIFKDYIFGRDKAYPNHLKPSPIMLKKAMSLADIPANQCLMIGDSITDYQAAKKAKVQFLGFTYTPSKCALLHAAGATFVTSTYQPWLDILKS